MFFYFNINVLTGLEIFLIRAKNVLICLRQIVHLNVQLSTFFDPTNYLNKIHTKYARRLGKE